MGRLKYLLVALAVTSSAYADGAAPPPSDAVGPAAQACQLQEVANLDMSIEPEGSVTIPVDIDGATVSMIVDTGNVRSEMTADEAFKRKLQFHYAAMPIQMAGGEMSVLLVYPKLLTVGRGGAQDYPLYVLSNRSVPANVAGFIGPDILSHYDVEFDFANGRFELYSQDHCPGKVIHWKTNGAAAVPFTFDEAGHIVIDVVLEGRPIKAVVDSGAQNSMITTRVAENLLGIKRDNAYLKSIGKTSLNGAKRTELYRYPFSTLTFEGISVSSPDVMIVGDDGFQQKQDSLLLGESVLRQLHVYIAYKEKMLYLSPAEEPASVPVAKK